MSPDDFMKGFLSDRADGVAKIHALPNEEKIYYAAYHWLKAGNDLKNGIPWLKGWVNRLQGNKAFSETDSENYLKAARKALEIGIDL